jgi:hypothetical protein
MTEPKITPAQRRALEAVRNGKCYRRYTAYGYVIEGERKLVISHLQNLCLINYGTDNIFHLTDAGRMALRRAEEQQ